MAEFRKLILRLLLVALGIAAVVGAIAVLTAGNVFAGRICGTAAATAVAAGLIIPLTILGDRDKSRGAGIYGIALVIVEYLLTLFLIWNESHRMFFTATNVEENIALTMLWLALTGIPAIYFLSNINTPQGKLACWVGNGLCALTFALLMIGTWVTTSWHDDSNWYGTGTAVGLIGLLGVGSLAGAGARWWRMVGAGAATVAIGVATFAIWNDIHGNAGLFATILSVAIVCAHANVCLLCPLKAGQGWLRVVTIIATIFTALLVDVLIASDRWTGAMLPLANLAGASGIIAGCGSLALLVLARLNRGVARQETVSDINEITLFCPACRKKQTVAVMSNNTAQPPACGNCGLRIRVHVEEPRCAKCNYLLLMLKSDRCPECGTPVGAVGVQSQLQLNAGDGQ